MGKLLIVSISDHEEHIFNRVMAAIADEPDFDHIAPPQSSLSFSNLEILLKEHTVYTMNLQSLHIWLVILAGYFLPARSTRLCGIRMVDTAELQLPV